MTPTIEIGTGKCIAVEFSLAPETPLSFLVPVYYEANQFNTLDGLGKIDEAFGISRLDIEPEEIRFWDRDERRIIFIQHLHAVEKYMTGKPDLILHEIIEKILVHFRVLQAFGLKITHEEVNRGLGGWKSEGTRIGDYSRIDAFGDIFLDQVAMSREIGRAHV